MMTRRDEIAAEQKLLLAVHMVNVFEGGFVRQERPKCCGKEIDLTDTLVDFKDVEVRGKSITLLEPYCPICGRKVAAIFNVLS